jgi:hypothetical protein
MKLRILPITFLIGFLSSYAVAQGHGFGLGAQFGTPTGVSGKAWLTRTGALQVGFGWPSSTQNEGTVLSIDYLLHTHVFRSTQQLPIFYGLGGVVGVSGTTAAGIRGVAGLAWWPHSSSLDIYFQVVPTIYFSPSSKFEFEFGMGIRYYF